VKPEHRITTGAFAIWLIVGGLFDLLGLIPFVENVIGIIFALLFGTYLWIKGMGVFKGKVFITECISLVGSFIPMIQSLPQLTAGVVAIFIISRLEEKVGISATSLTSGKGIRTPVGRNPLNQGGIRAPRV